MTASTHEPETWRIAGIDVPVVTAGTVVVGTGSAGYCAAVRLVDFGRLYGRRAHGRPDVVMVTDKVRAGTSRNAGSDKQTYYKLTLAGSAGDSVREMAQTLYDGGAMDGDNALAEAAWSTRCFMRLVDLGVPFPQNPYGEFVGYKTDHDPRQRATSVGPYTSRTMVERLEARARADGTRVYDGCRVVDTITEPTAEGGRRVAGLLVLRQSARSRERGEQCRPTPGIEPAAGGGRSAVASPPGGSPFLLFRCANLVYATGGPAGLYATRVFPNGQWGASGAAYRAGVRGKNLTEWQFGLASLRPRWNVSGSYMQVMPRFVSTAEDGSDEREFLAEAIGDYARLLQLTFLKGYQWPFDVRKASDGSSLIDLLVYRETVLRCRRVYLDFRRNPVRADLDLAALPAEAYDYLAAAGALAGTPVERLRRMNEPAYQFYKEKNPSVDLETTLLEVDVCAQHNNGGLVVDAWWQSNLSGFFPVGEAAGAHGVYRPGGAALNSGQVGASRAAQYIAARGGEPAAEAAFVAAAAPVLAGAMTLLEGATGRAEAGKPDNTGDLLDRLQRLMSAEAGPVRSAESIDRALTQVRTWLAEMETSVAADGTSRRSIDRLFLVRDLLTTAYVYLTAMADYVARGGNSRGSALYTDPSGRLPQVDTAGPGATLPEVYRFRLDDGALDEVVQEAGWAPGGAVGTVAVTWRPRRPIPHTDDVFENVWRDFRDHGAVMV